MNKLVLLSLLALLCVAGKIQAQEGQATAFQPVPELGYRVMPDFFHPPDGVAVGEASGVALNSKGQISLPARQADVE
jgi:hypothetical protein